MEPTTDIARGLFTIIASVFDWAVARFLVNRPDLVAHLGRINLARWRARRAVHRLDRLVARWRAGKRLTPRRRTPPAVPAPRTPNGTANPLLQGAVPRGLNWLGRLIQPANIGRGQLEAHLQTPEVQALIAAAPQVGRIYRPLCRMLGAALPEALHLPPRAPRPPRPRAPKPARRRLFPHASTSPPHLRLQVPTLRQRRKKPHS